MTEDPSFAQINFSCEHCHKPVLIGVGMPPTTAPCPHCGYAVTSPEQASGQEATSSVLEEYSATEASKTVEKKSKTPMVSAAAVVVLALCGAGLWVVGNSKKESETQSSPPEDIAIVTPPSPVAPEEVPVEVIEEIPVALSLEDETAQLLSDFLAASSPEEKMQYVIPNEGVLEGLENYFPIGVSNDELPLSSFVFRQGNEQDRQRGIYLMSYHRSAEVGIQEYFQPVESIDAATQEEDSLLDEAVRAADRNSDSQELSVSAFFKKTEAGLKLDSSVFIQSKFRTFQAFTGYPQPGKSKTFRVVMSEMVRHDLHDDDTQRAYRVSDFAYPKDFISVAVEKDSELADDLSVLNWRGTQEKVTRRMATVELMWTESSPPELELKSLLCWEFLGVGGELEEPETTEEEESN